MESTQLGLEDNKNVLPLTSESDEESTKYLTNNSNGDGKNLESTENERVDKSFETVNEHENQLKDRIAQCKNIIEALKQELNEEKCKMQNICKSPRNCSGKISRNVVNFDHYSPANVFMDDLKLSSNAYSVCVDSKLSCDENLVEYEKQLQKYQNTLNMAQLEKKNAIRKQMLSKAFRLKLLEVENQCNIELLRVKQSLACLEPLKMIANQWKSSNDDVCDSNFDLLPRYPDFSSNFGSDVTSLKELEVNAIADKSEKCAKVDSIPPDA